MLQRISMYKKQAFLLVAGLLIAATLYLSLATGAPALHIANGDKYGHFLAYFVLMSWFGLIYPSIPSWLTSAVLLGCMSIGIEFLQELSATRAFELGDVAASVAGVFVALVILLAGLRRTDLPSRSKTGLP